MICPIPAHSKEKPRHREENQGHTMKELKLLLWVTQFGLSILVPPCFLLWVAVALRSRYGLGMWIIAVLGILGLMTSFSTAKANLRAMRKDAEEAGSQKAPPVSFNDHV